MCRYYIDYKYLYNSPLRERERERCYASKKCTEDGYYFPDGGFGDPNELVEGAKEDILRDLSKELEIFSLNKSLSHHDHGPSVYHQPTKPSLCHSECKMCDSR